MRDKLTAGFGSEIVATLVRDAFFDLDASIERLALPDGPRPHSPQLPDAILPRAQRIAQVMRDIVSI